MDSEITLDNLSTISVSVKTMNYVIIDETKYYVGEPHRHAYVNSTYGRTCAASELSEPYLSAIMSIWGDEPTVTEPVEG